MTPNASDLAALTRHWFEQVWNRGNEAVIDELLAPNGIIHGLGDDKDLRGPADFRVFYRQFRSGLTDIHIMVDDVLVEGDRTAGRFTVTAVHSGDGLGVPATGRRINVTGMCFTHWHNGQLIEGWNEFDQAGLLKQIGAIGTPAKVKV